MINLPEIGLRVFWALAIIAAGLVFYALLNRLILFRAQRNMRTRRNLRAEQQPTSRAAPEEALIPNSGVPAILYFTTPECAPCRTIQRPALQRLQDRLGDRLQVIEINAAERPDLASRWGVLSVPTTFVLDAQGQPRHVNHGATRAEKLMQQMEGLFNEAT